MRIVLAHGTFDWLHYGHVLFLRKAATLGELLVVSITADDYVNKGPGRPLYTQEERYKFLSELRCVNTVYICYAADALPAIQAFKPAVYVKGEDYLTTDKHGHLEAEFAAVRELGGEPTILRGLPISSSTDIIRRFHATSTNHPAG